MGYSVEKEKGGDNFVIVNEDGDFESEVYGTRRAAIRAMGQLQKFEAENKKRTGDPKKPDPKKAVEDAEEGDDEE